MKVYTFLILCLLLNTSPIFSQDKQDELSQYFDDDNISQRKNILKVSPVTLLAGDIPVFFERVIAPVLSIEVGAGLLLNMTSIELFGRDDQIFANLGPGYSFWINPKFYYAGKAPEFQSFGFLYRRREYFSGLTYSDFVFTSAVQFFLLKRLIMELSGGIGLRQIEVQAFSSLNPALDVDLVMPYSLKVGYVF